MGATAPAQRLDAGARERRAEGVAAAQIVALQVADAAVDSGRRGRRRAGGVQAALFEALGEAVRQQHLADQAALPDHGVDHAGPAGELHAFGGGAGEARLATPVVGRLLVRSVEREQFVGADPRGVHDLGGERVAVILAGDDGAGE